MPPKKKTACDLFFDIEKLKILEAEPNTKTRTLNIELKKRWAAFNLPLVLPVTLDSQPPTVSLSVTEKTYEVSKPFHLFSLEKRKIYIDYFPLEKAIEITAILRVEYRKLTTTEKLKYSLGSR